MRWALAIALVLLAGCQGTTEPEVVATATAVEGVTAPGVADSGVSCDAGDAAFVELATLHLWGRRPLSIRERDLLVQVVESRGREALLRAMMRSEAFAQRWQGVLRDLLFINRAGRRTGAGCNGAPLLEGDRGELATFIRDTAADAGSYPEEWNLTDLVLSAIHLDDLSPLLRGYLFAQAGTVVIDADDPNDELAWRRIYASIFERQLLNRRMDCLRCHNSEYSVTPATTFAPPGRFERALYGEPTGRSFDDLAAMFRVKGVLSMTFNPEGPNDFWLPGPGISPWGMAKTCGQFLAPDEVVADELGYSGFLVHDYGDTSSLWDLEQLLAEGFDRARDGLETDASGELQGAEALGWLVASGVAHRVWSEVMGNRLTIANFFPRNAKQRDALMHVAEVFTGSGFSLKDLLVAVLTHPYANQAPPAECQGLDTAYYLAPIFDPWRQDDEDPTTRQNSVGDVLHRLPPRLLLSSATAALEWTPYPETFFPDPTLEEAISLPPDAAFGRDIGLFLADAETGFRGSNFQEMLAWEERMGACTDPFGHRDADFIDRLVAVGDPHTVGDAVLALKDRLLNRTDLAQGEQPLLERLLGQPFDTALSAQAEPGLRRVCLALLSSPQFALGGVRAPGTSTPPSLVVPGTEPGTLCPQIATLLDPSPSCTPNGLTFE